MSECHRIFLWPFRSHANLCQRVHVSRTSFPLIKSSNNVQSTATSQREPLLTFFPLWELSEDPDCSQIGTGARLAVFGSASLT